MTENATANGAATADAHPPLPGRRSDAPIRNDYAINHPEHLLIEHAGQYAAWSMDGRRLLATGATGDELFDRVNAMGLDGNEFVFEHIHPDYALLRSEP